MNTADQAIHENKIRLKFIFCRYRIKNKTLFLFYVYGDKAEDLLASISKGLVPIQLNWIGLFWIVFSLSEQGSSASVISIYCKMPSAFGVRTILEQQLLLHFGYLWLNEQDKRSNIVSSWNMIERTWIGCLLEFHEKVKLIDQNT